MSIKIKLFGGLGNQMFQFATAYSIAKSKNIDLYLDLSWFNRSNIHNGFELDKVFDIFKKVSFLNNDFNFTSFKLKEFLNKIDITYQIFKEPHFNYSQNITKLPNHCFLKGYWQSETYFKEYKDEIKKIFSFDKNLDSVNLKIIDKIYRSNSASLHIRRGDFLLKKNQNHQTNLNNYYSKAIREVSKNYNNLKFFIFSDDPNWVSNNFEIKTEYEVINNNLGKKSYIDMYLMSLCKTNIIANSTFSWWAGWLNENENKNIFAPNNWFNDKSINTKDLIPKSWIII
jgi:hypothetical protein